MTLIRKHGTLAKTVSFAVVHFSVAFGVGYLLTGSIGIAMHRVSGAAERA